MLPDLTNLSDEEVARLFKDGQESAFDELYRRYQDKLRRMIYFHLGDSVEAEDVFHDVFLRVFRHIGSYKTDRPFSSWIYRIAVNCSRNTRKKSVKNDMLFEREKEEFREGAKDNELKLSPETAFFRDSDMKEFYSVVGELKEKFRVVFLMRYREGLRYADIADMLRCSERTVKWRMKRAIEIIVDELKVRGVI